MELIKYRVNSDLKLDVIENFLSKPIADNTLKELEFLFNEKGLITKKRSSLILGDENIDYITNYKGNITHRPTERYPNCILNIKKKLERFMKNNYNDDIKFNVCIIQRYPTGKIGILPHRDKEMVHGTKICGISLGQPRILEIGQGFQKSYKTIVSHELSNGSLYIMIPPTNDKYTHSIRKDESSEVRISLTFRDYLV